MSSANVDNLIKNKHLVGIYIKKKCFSRKSAVMEADFFCALQDIKVGLKCFKHYP